MHENGHQAGQADDPQQAVFVLRAAGQVGAPIARVHVTDADENGRPDKRPPLLPETGLMMRHFHAPVHAFQRHRAGPVSDGRAVSRRAGKTCGRAIIRTHNLAKKSATNKKIHEAMFLSINKVRRA